MGRSILGAAQSNRAAALLPEPIPASPQQSSAGKSLLTDGCYLIKYTPTRPNAVSYDGTIRVETTTGRLIASGDLYEHEIFVDDDLNPVEVVPDPAAGVPIFPIRSYRFYLRLTNVREAGDGFALDFEVLRFSAEEVMFFDGTKSNWLMEGTFTAVMAQAPAEGTYPSPELFFTGNVADETGTTVGSLTMGWVSPFLRKATIEIDRVAASEAPMSNGAGVDWKSVFDKIDWDPTVVPSDSNVVEPNGETWNRAEAHAAMEARRDKSDLNTEWRYHILAVQKIKKVPGANLTPLQIENGESGHMYDDISFGKNTLPREGLMVASHWKVPDEEKWGLVRGMRGALTVNYFRAAVHELGHAMGLRHNKLDNGFMNTSEEIADTGTKDKPFPTNIMWAFAADDEHRLRHWPDLIVRPGGAGSSFGGPAPTSAFKSERHRLDVVPLLSAVPLGAPVRVNLTLRNLADKPVDSPSSLSLNSGFVRGHVVDPAGKVRTFSPLVVNENHHATQKLAPDTPLEDSLTLLQGGQGALFPAPGVYRIVVEVAWHGETTDDRNKLDFIVTGESNVTVTAAEDDAHRDAARKVLATPDALLALALGGDHLKQGIEAIHAALKSRVLRPHFAYVEAKRLATRFFDRMPDFKAAAQLVDQTTVMSPAESKKAEQIVKGDAL